MTFSIFLPQCFAAIYYPFILYDFHFSMNDARDLSKVNSGRGRVETWKGSSKDPKNGGLNQIWHYFFFNICFKYAVYKQLYELKHKFERPSIFRVYNSPKISNPPPPLLFFRIGPSQKTRWSYPKYYKWHSVFNWWIFS